MVKTKDYYTMVELLYAGEARPRLHPNGFIQLDLTLDGTKRIHVWPDKEIQAQKTRHPIHDHVFDMTSTIVRGALTNLVYRFNTYPQPQFGQHQPHAELYQAKQIGNNDTVLAPTGFKGYLELVGEDSWTYLAGETYELSAQVFHDSIPHGLTATVMEKTKVLKDYKPFVVVPFGIEPDNDFRRETVDPDILWDFVFRALKDE